MALRLLARKLHPLSQRQYEVLMLYGDGHTYHQIAVLVGLSYKTVCRHFEELRSKLGVHSAAEAYLQIRRLTRER